MIIIIYSESKFYSIVRNKNDAKTIKSVIVGEI